MSFLAYWQNLNRPGVIFETSADASLWAPAGDVVRYEVPEGVEITENTPDFSTLTKSMNDWVIRPPGHRHHARQVLASLWSDGETRPVVLGNYSPTLGNCWLARVSR